MATKRMFDKAIIDTDRFMDLAISSKALYFLLGMEADDEGFVSYKKVMRIHGGNEDDVKVLIAKRFLIGFQSGVVVITDWNKNNWLDKRRIKPTEYQTEKKMISVSKDNQYVLSDGLAMAELEEYRGVESRTVENSFFNTFWKEYPNKENKKKCQDLWESKKLDSKHSEIIDFISKAKKTDRWQKGFIKAPDVFLRNENWNDDLKAYGGANKQEVYKNKNSNLVEKLTKKLNEQKI